MVFSLSFGGVEVRLSSTSNDTDTIKGVRHCNDGNIELDVSNFTGTIVLSADAPSTEPSTSTENEVVSRDMQVVQGVPEELSCSLSTVLQKFSSSSPSNSNNTATISTNNNIADGIQRQSSFLTANSHTSQIEPTAYIPQHNNSPELLSQQNSQLTVEMDSKDDDDEEKKMQHVQDDEIQSSGLVRFSINKPHVIPDLRPEEDLTLHEMCASDSDDVEIDDLRDVLRSKSELASVQDQFGDYAAHIFANNDSFIYTSSDCKFYVHVLGWTSFSYVYLTLILYVYILNLLDEVMEFVLELYKACPSAFL